MTQYNTLNVKLSNSQLNELKSGIKNETEVVSIENLKNLKYDTSYKKHWFFLLFAVSATMKIKKIFKEEESIEILKIVVLNENI